MLEGTVIHFVEIANEFDIHLLKLGEENCGETETIGCACCSGLLFVYLVCARCPRLTKASTLVL